MQLHKKLVHRILLGSILFISGLFLIGFWTSFQVRITTETIVDNELNQVLNGKIVVHITDLHMASMGFREQKVLSLLNDLTPDIVFLTGDYIHWNGDVKRALDFFSRIEAATGVFGVIGEYDSSNDRKSCLFCHVKGSRESTTTHPVHMMNNSGEVVRVGENSLYIYGVTESNQMDDYVKKQLSQMAPDTPMIVLSHNPLKFELMDKNKNALMIAGDTHGGQLPLPSFIWKILGYEKNEKYNYGYYQEGQKKMFVSRGVGYSHLPFRLFADPEIVVYRFIKGKN